LKVNKTQHRNWRSS